MKKILISILFISFALQISVAQNVTSFTDKRDNKTYQTVTLGTTVWMAENLNYTTKNSWCINCEVYGRHYTYEDALTACPEGWRLSTFDDWKKIFMSLDIGAVDIKSTTGWDEKGNGNNDYKFGALPGGKCNSEGRVDMQGSYGFWWIKESKDDSKAQYWYLGSDIDYLDFDSEMKTSGLSVRCVKN